MRILLVNDFDKIVGGTERYVHELSQALKKRGHGVFKYSPPSSGSRFSGIYNNLVRKEIRKAVSEKSIEIIHAHNILNRTSPSFIVGSRVPIVMTLHDFGMICPNSLHILPNGSACSHSFGWKCAGECIPMRHFVPESVKYKIKSIMMKKVDLFIAPSNFLKKQFEHAGMDNIKLLRNAINVGKKEKNLDYGNNILFVSRLGRRKGCRLLIKAFDSISSDFPQTRLDVVGTGPEKDYLKKISKRNKRITLHGYISDEELPVLHRRCNFFILASTYPENCPMRILESYKFSKPVIGSDLGGVPEIIIENKTGFLFDPHNFRNLSDKMKILLSDFTKSKKLGNSARRFLERNHNMDTHVLEIEKLYHSML